MNPTCSTHKIDIWLNNCRNTTSEIYLTVQNILYKLSPPRLNSYIYATSSISIIRTMKKLCPFLLFFLLFGIPSQSQDLIRLESCSSGLMNKQVDSLKSLYEGEGYVLLKEASIKMESAYEMPVIVPLTQGSWYQFVFIGDYTSKLYEVRMYDWQEKMVIFRQKRWGDVDGNVITYTYIPKFSEFHMMKPVQVNKKKKRDLCGYVMLFKRTKQDEVGAVQSTDTNTGIK